MSFRPFRIGWVADVKHKTVVRKVRDGLIRDRITWPTCGSIMKVLDDFVDEARVYADVGELVPSQHAAISFLLKLLTDSE